MKHFFTTLSICFAMLGFAFAKPIDRATAQTVAANFYAANAKTPAAHGTTAAQLTLATQNNAKIGAAQADEAALFYIFNVNNVEGYVIVAADDAALPILAYSDQGGFSTTNMPNNLVKWLEQYKQEMAYIIREDLKADAEITAQWSALKTGAASTPKSITSVAPLVATRWNQSPGYNAQCPGGSVTGCVATAMAQVMKYWNHPAQGTGFHSYNEADYGTLSANFGNTTYNWSSMPNTSSNSSVATLMYHCGVSVDMNYGLAGAGGSSAQTLDVVNALKTYFGYAASIQGLYRTSYTESAWITLLKTELNASRPIQYAGTGSGGGHSFVCDGYDNNDYFHFNWGWGGSSDGYFNINSLNPGALGTGGGTGGFNSNQRAIIGIQPIVTSSPTTFDMYSSITVNPNPINYGQSVTVNADIVNRGNSTFYGDITAALFDSNNNFVEYIETLTETNGLPANYHYTNGNNFTSSALSAAPGNYYIGIYVKPTNGNWIAVSNGSYQNYIPITIVAANDIQMYSTITVSPLPVVQNQAFSVSADVANFGGATFSGTVSVDLHGLDGTWLQLIDEYTSLSLPSNTHFTNPLAFSSTGVSVAPGTYQVAVWEQATGGSWSLVQATASFPNPRQITIVAPSISADPYENNNTQATAYNLSLSFSGNAATRTTVGSNNHIGTDYDFYKITVPAGYTYTINARLHDSYNTGNGSTYTNDDLWSYSVGGSVWSSTYDDVLTSGTITATAGTTVYFQVAPYFSGNTGTYLFDMQVTRTAVTATTDFASADAIKVFPNPANNFINIVLADGVTIENLDIYTINGQLIYTQNKVSNLLNIPMDNTPNGLYLLRATTNKGQWNGKIIINH